VGTSGGQARRYRFAASWAALSIAAAAATLAAGCGVGLPHTINAASAAAEISSQLASRYEVAAPKVTCPTGVADKKGQTFSCQAVLDGETVVLDAAVTDTGGAFTVTPESAIVVVAAAVNQLSQEIGVQTGQAPTVTCGTKLVLVVKVGSAFPCTATFPGQTARAVTVTVVNIQGAFTFILAPAA